jgi:hypothetical protein
VLTDIRLYHLSKNPLDIGTILESQFVKHQFQWEAVESALGEADNRIPILKSLLLADRFIGKGRSVLPFVLKEVVLERIRANQFPARPSRLDSIFLCPSMRDAIRFRDQVRQTYDRPHLYLCTVDDLNKGFCADMSWVGNANPLAPMKEQLDHLIKNATSYWQGRQSQNPITEILTPTGIVKVAAQAEW